MNGFSKGKSKFLFGISSLFASLLLLFLVSSNKAAEFDNKNHDFLNKTFLLLAGMGSVVTFELIGQALLERKKYVRDGNSLYETIEIPQNLARDRLVGSISNEFLLYEKHEDISIKSQTLSELEAIRPRIVSLDNVLQDVLSLKIPPMILILSGLGVGALLLSQFREPLLSNLVTEIEYFAKANQESNKEENELVLKKGGQALTLPVLATGGSSSVSSTNPSLRNSARGPQVAALQYNLKMAGLFNRPITGIYDSSTEQAVRQFQENNSLVVDGIAGPVTTALLRGEAYSGSTTSIARVESPNLGGTTISTAGVEPPNSDSLKIGVIGSEVAALQARLRDIGLLSGPVSGAFGPITEDAVRRFQSAQGLTADGVVGPATLAALQNYRATSASTSAPQNIGGEAIATTDGGSLRLNDAGPQVERLQTNLRILGLFNGTVTGFYGPMTEEAVRQFQASNDLVADGIAGLVTQRAAQSAADVVRSSGGSSTTEVSGPPRFSVLELQTRLWQLGFYRGEPNGMMGPETEAAIRAAQRFYRVSTDDFKPQTP